VPKRRNARPRPSRSRPRGTSGRNRFVAGLGSAAAGACFAWWVLDMPLLWVEGAQSVRSVTLGAVESAPVRELGVGPSLPELEGAELESSELDRSGPAPSQRGSSDLERPALDSADAQAANSEASNLAAPTIESRAIVSSEGEILPPRPRPWRAPLAPSPRPASLAASLPASLRDADAAPPQESDATAPREVDSGAPASQGPAVPQPRPAGLASRAPAGSAAKAGSKATAREAQIPAIPRARPAARTRTGARLGAPRAAPARGAPPRGGRATPSVGRAAVQVSTFGREESARDLAIALQQAGFASYVLDAQDADAGLRYKVRVRGHQGEGVESLLERLGETGHSGGRVIGP